METGRDRSRSSGGWWNRDITAVSQREGQAGQMGREKCPQLRGELTSELLLIREKWIKGSFTPFSLLRSSKQPHPSPCSSRGADFLAQGPGHPQISQPGFPPASCRQGKAKAPARRDVAPGHPLLSSLCHEGLHHPAQTRAGIGSPKTPNLAWARAHQQTGSTQAFPLFSS